MRYIGGKKSNWTTISAKVKDPCVPRKRSGKTRKVLRKVPGSSGPFFFFVVVVFFGF